MLRVAICLAVFVSVLAAIGSPDRAVAQEIGVVKSVDGDVLIRRAGADMVATVGAPIHRQDRIVAARESTIGATLDDGTTLSVSGPSNVEVSAFVFDPGGGLFDLVVRVLSGRLVYRSGRIGEARPDRVRIETPQLVVGTRGTRFAVIVPDQGQ